MADIAGIQPSVPDHRGRFGGFTQVSQHDIGPLDRDFSLGTRRQWLAGIVMDLNRNVGQRLTHCRGFVRDSDVIPGDHR